MAMLPMVIIVYRKNLCAGAIIHCRLCRCWQKAAPCRLVQLFNVDVSGSLNLLSRLRNGDVQDAFFVGGVDLIILGIIGQAERAGKVGIGILPSAVFRPLASSLEACLDSAEMVRISSSTLSLQSSRLKPAIPLRPYGFF